ncbi:MAG: type IV pilus secretin PilQ [Acidobacteriota bacterium]
MKSLPKCSCAGVALFLLCGFGWCGAMPLRASDMASETVVVSTLDVRSDALRVTSLQLQSTARLDYNVSKPEPRLVSIDLYGADISALQPEYRTEQGLVASVVVKSGLVGQSTSRLDITLREDCQVRSYLRNDGKTLIVEFVPLGLASAGEPSEAVTARVTGQSDPHPKAGVSASAQPVVFKKGGVGRTAKAVSARLPMLQSVTLSEGEQITTAELGLTAKAKYNHFLLQNPPRLVVDLLDAVAAVEKRVLAGSDKVVARVRVGEPGGHTTRVVFDLKQSVPYTVSESETGLVVQFGDHSVITSRTPVHSSAVTASAPSSPLNAPPLASPDPVATETSTVAEQPVSSSVRQTSAKPEPAALTVPSARSALPTVSAPAASAPPVKGKTTLATVSGTSANAPAPSAGRAPQSGRGAQFGDPSYQGDPVSLDITNVDLSDILRFISDNYDVNFVLDKSVGKVPVTLKVNQVPWTQVLESIFRANQLTYRREGLIIRVATVAALTAEEQNRRNQRLQEIYSAPTVTEYFKLKYERVDQQAAQQQAAGGAPLQGPSGQPMGGLLGGIGFVSIVQQTLSPTGRISINPRTNTVIITDIPSYLEKVRDVIARLDVPEPQVEIEARIVFASRNFARELGVQLFAAATTRQGRTAAFSTSAGTFLNTTPSDITTPASLAPGLLIGPVAAPGISGGGSSVLALTTGPIGTSLLATTLTANEQKGIVKSIAAPRVTVLNNAEATIVSGTQIPFIATAGVGVAQTVTFVNANIGMTITPQITTEGNVLLRIVVTNDAPGQLINGFTSINRRSATTQVIVPDGGTTIVGGVLNDIETTNVFRTPGISSLPLLGELFKRRDLSRTTGELLFFITPRIGRGENILSGGEPPVSPQPATSGGQP